MAKSWFQVVKDALQMYKDRDKYAYFYGAKNGVILTQKVMENLWNAEPEYFKKYTADEKKQIFKNSLGKQGYDCSGFVTKVTGETGYSKTIYAKRTKETTLAQGVAGQFLYTTFGGTGRHIGIDAGLGFTLDMGNESTDAIVAQHRDSVRLLNIGDLAWEHSFQTAAVNYNGAYGTDPNVFPCEGKATTAVYVRKGPSTAYEKQKFNRNDGLGDRTYLQAGESVEIIGQSNGWYQLNIQGKSQFWQPWASAKYIQL